MPLRYHFLPTFRWLLPFLLLPLQAEGQTSVLFIGNSYTSVNDLPNMFRQLAQSLGESVTVGMSAPGGYTYQMHASYAPTLDAIASQPWDFVVLQEQSQLPSFPQAQVESDVFPYALGLADFIEGNNECTWPVFFMTWGRENGDASNCPNWPPVCTYEGMQQLLRERYLSMAFANMGYAAPVGVAWQRVREADPTMQLYAGDGSHPSVAGTYLTACVFYSSLFQQSSAGASYTAGLSPATASLLQNIASAAVLDSLDTWNLNVPNGTDASITGSSSSAPGIITYYHPGQGTHLWNCTNGQVFTVANPTFTFETTGIYTITHNYTDPCGNTDSDTWTLDVLEVGVEEHAWRSPYRVGTCGPSVVEVIGGTGGEEFTLLDTQGRTLSTRKLDRDHLFIPAPNGPLFWRIRDRDGASWSGKVLVP